MDLRIGIDAWPALRHAPGIGRYSRELVRALVELDDPRLSLRLFEVGPGRASLSDASIGLDLERARVERLRLRLPRRAIEWSARFGFGAERWLGGVDLFQRVFVDSPALGGVRQCVPVFELPARDSPADRRFGERLRAIEDVMCFSAWSAREVVDRYALAPQRVHRVPVGCDHWVRDLGAPTEKRTPPRIVVLGAIARRRRSLELLGALAELEGRGLDFECIFCGRAGDAEREFRAAIGGARRVRWIEQPIERDLPELVASSSLLVHLNVDECSAVTPLEAFALGTHVLASSIPTFVEELGELADFVDANGAAESLATSIRSALEHSNDAARHERAREFAAHLTWEANARATIAIWREIVAR